jgi:hypothetical protein
MTLAERLRTSCTALTHYGFLVLALLLCSCHKQTWDAFGYKSRESPDSTSVFLGTYASEKEARAAGVAFTKTHPNGDYEIAKRDRRGGYAESKR